MAHSHRAVSTRHGYLLCLMQKVGCSNWLHYLRVRIVEGRRPPVDYELPTYPVYRCVEQAHHGLPETPYLYSNDNEAAHDLYWLNAHLGVHEREVVPVLLNSSTFKAVVVRDPWARAVRFDILYLGPSPLPRHHNPGVVFFLFCSGYRDKVLGAPLRALFNYGLVTPLTAGVTRATWHLGHNMTFHEFIVALAATQRESQFGFNAHFMPQTQLCAIGRFPYDFIADVSASRLCSMSSL
jgi:hypothetical protein